MDVLGSDQFGFLPREIGTGSSGETKSLCCSLARSGSAAGSEPRQSRHHLNPGTRTAARVRREKRKRADGSPSFSSDLG
jgi:hypothetical protein